MLLAKSDLKKIILGENVSILEVIKNLNSSGLKLVLINSSKNEFQGIINDGDIRRGFAKGFTIKTKAKLFLKKKPFVIKNAKDLSRIHAKTLNTLVSVPIIKNKKIQGLFVNTTEVKVSKKILEDVVIMAGGFGRRLGALTKKCPKALLKFNNKPLLQHIIEHLKKNNFLNLRISVFFLKNTIKKFINYNKSFALNINFIQESKPMGTIGSLRLIKSISKDFIVLNCDIVSDINLKNLLSFHKKNKSLLTICVKNFQYKNPYGVIKSNKNKFISFKEKPEINFSINAGIYVFNKKIINIMNKYKIDQIEELILFLQKKKYKILTYQILENWRDFGSDKKNLKRLIL